ncbi:PREDICTED: NLR family CARD domain-containing protein 4-like [Branchiostoma belcheri]|uniref:NLR family CARD domain-containing protein 4-like n=1 Tax=Branchiostoma belcheri TaxID=7741 RepID=A0A6P4ZHI1_BRABE|nr:PREDICTED: NLR family CARD domain-containing protein 4-like [Branchiostoma belcheri]
MATGGSPEPVYTSGTARGARLASLLIDEGTSLLKKVFEDEIRKMNPPSLQVQLRNHKRHLCSLRYFNCGQRNMLYPRSGNIPNTTQGFDISLLELLLKELCKDAPYANARARLRVYRNTYYGHISSTELSQDLFDKLWKELADILVALGADMNAISERLKSSIDPEKEKTYFNMLDQLNKEDKEVKDILLAHGEILKTLQQTVSELSGASSTQKDQTRPGSIEEGVSFHKRRRLDESEAGSNQEAGPSHILSDVIIYQLFITVSEADKAGDVLRSALSINYSNTLNTLKPLPWDDRFCLDLDRIFTSLVLVSLHDQTDRRILKSLEDVYDHQTVSDLDRRFNVLVEGHAGSGKSTLLSKTALDWSCKKGRLADMKKIVLLVRLREVQPGESIAEIVWDQCVTKSAKGISISAIETCLQDNESKLVFLLDGYDELVPNAKGPRQVVPELLAKKWYPNSTVIVTSRPLSGIEEYMVVGCKVKVAGFSSADVEGFTATYFQTIGKSDLAAPLIKALQANVVARNLIQTPIFIMLICVLWEDDPDRVFPGTMSGLYQELLTCVIRKHCVREGLSMSDDKIPCELSPILLNLGKLALESLLRGESLVDLGKAAAVQDTDILLKLGIVSKEVSASRLHPRKQLNFPHKTMQEFLAGRYVAETVNTSSGDLHELVPLDTVWRVLQQSTLVHFICGCGGKATKEMLTKIYKLYEAHVAASVATFNYTKTYVPQDNQTKSDSVKELCMMNLYESQDCRYFPIVSNLLSSLDCHIKAPSREAAALMYYLQHAAVVPKGRLLRLRVTEDSKGEAVEYLSGMLENYLPDLCLDLSFNNKSLQYCHIGDKFDKLVTFFSKKSLVYDH